MGFAVDTAITVDADLTKYAFEQQITNLLRSGNTYADLHKGAVNTLVAEHLRPRGFNTASELSAIANSDDFRPALTYWVLSRIFGGMGGAKPVEREQALSKASYYLALYRESIQKVTVDPGDSTVKGGPGLPFAVNVDGGTMYPALGASRPGTVAETKIPNYTGIVVEGV